MRYYIDDEITIDLDVSNKIQPVVETDFVCEEKFIKEEVIDIPVVVLNNEEEPEVSQLQVIDYGTSSIEVSFNVSTDRAEEVVKGILCGTTNPPTFENADFRLLHGQGSMDLVYAGLRQNTEYYLRPYALSNLGYKYGDVIAHRTKTSPIPDEYQLVEYLESIGTQYIVVTTTSNTRPIGIYMEYSIIENSLSDSSIAGQINDNAPYIGFISNLGAIFAYKNGTGYDYSISMPFGNIIKCAINYNKDRQIIVNDLVCHQAGAFYTNAKPFLLFNAWYSSPYAGCPCRINLAKLQEFSNTVLDDYSIYKEYSLYPVYRKTDNIPGMYDIINNIFYTNQGSGEFIVGPDTEWNE